MPTPTEEPIAYLFRLEQFGIKLGLNTMRLLVDALDAPDRNYQSILVAGTNGKGSVAAMIERGLRTDGYRTGLFTSPHLVKLSERFVVNGLPVQTSTLASEARQLHDTIDRLQRSGKLNHQPTFFEATTALTLALFRQQHVDVAILEVGMGGRFDATNVVDPVAVAIPTIDFDHQQYLGSTLAQIAFEKASIIRQNGIAVTAESKSDPGDVLRVAAAARHARHIRADVDTSIRWHVEEGETRIEEIVTPHGKYGPTRLALRGQHQLVNAAVAVRLLEELSTAGIPVSHKAIDDALADTQWPGRLDLIELAPNRRVLLDPAHNVAAARALAAHIAAWKPAGLPLVFSALKDKDISGILHALGNTVTRITCTTIDNPRACSIRDLIEITRSARPDLTVTVVSDPFAALLETWKNGPLAVAAGSVFLVGELMGKMMPNACSSTPTPARM